MKANNNLQPYLDTCAACGLTLPPLDSGSMAPAFALTALPSQWRELARAAKLAKMRWCGFWVQEIDTGLEAFSCMELGGSYLIIRTKTGTNEPIPSIASIFPSADRPERHAHDLLGIQFENQPDNRRWTRHKAWNKTDFPLRADFRFIPSANPIPGDHDYPFVPGYGPGVVEIPVGPIHAGIIEPGHFRF
ncbi:MAG: NADH-quinone oxidoreductase subunit C, partial [Pseudohongiellaceae bacterium]